jgi:beta-lactamase class C
MEPTYLCSMRCFYVVALFAFFCCSCGPNDNSLNTNQVTRQRSDIPVKEPLDSVSQALVSRYHSYFAKDFALQQGLGAAVVLVRSGKVVSVRGYGLRSAQGRDSVTAKTVFRVGSLSKGFTGILAALMAQQGKLALGDKVTKWLPEFRLKDKMQTQRVQIKHLLSHTTGLPYHAYTNLVEEGYTLDRIVRDYFPKSPVCGREGVFYAYQNAAFALTGTIMAKASGKPFGVLLQEQLLAPLGMATTTSDFGSIEASSDKALPHQWSGWNWVPEPISKEYYNVAEAGGINASIEDMGHWLEALVGAHPEVLPTEVVDEVLKPIVKTGKERRILGNWVGRDAASYGLGWRVLDRGDGRTLAYHSGYVNGYRGEIAFDRQTRSGICVLFNAQIPLARTCVPDFFEMLDEIAML